MKKRTYLCIDLKSFYASVECVERHLDPLKTNLVVADLSRTEKTICLAVSPSLKAYGLKGRSRLFEVIQKVKQINQERKKRCPYPDFLGKSVDDSILRNNNELALDYITATPRMHRYIEVSSDIYAIYLKYVAKEDIHVYSIDEAFLDVTDYLKNVNLNAHELCRNIIREIYQKTGISATGGIGSNMYLAKVAMDIIAKHVKADQDGVRIAKLDELSYQKQLWSHTPLTDFWRVGKGYEKRLERLGLYTMGDIARCSLGKEEDYYNEDLLFDEFGVNAELLIDHAWGYEPTTIKDIHDYHPKENSLSLGQVIHCPYDYAKTRTLIIEMAEELSLKLVDKNLLCDSASLFLIYDVSNLKEDNFHGTIKKDYMGRDMPKPDSGSLSFAYTSSTKKLRKQFLSLYDRICDRSLLIRKINLSAHHLKTKEEVYLENKEKNVQLSLFENEDNKKKEEEEKKKEEDKETQVQKTLLSIKKRFGKNAVLKVEDLLDEATTKNRNDQIGGHKA